MTNRLYDTLKWIALVVIPAVATFIGATGVVWGWEFTEPVVLTLTAAGVLLGSTLGVSSKSYAREKEENHDEAELDDRDDRPRHLA